MKSKLCSVLVVLCIAVLSATAAHADEPDDVGVEETVSEPGEPAEPVTAQPESEVLRYYRGIGAEPTEAELKSGLEAATEMLLADVAIQQMSLAIDEAIKRHEKGEAVPFELVVPRFVRALAEEESRSTQGDASAAAQQPAWRAAADQKIRELRPRARAATVSESGEPAYPVPALHDRKKGKRLMTAAFVAQGISFGTTFASIFSDQVILFNWAIQASTIPFAPMGVVGFALRYGSSSENARLRWTGIGLLQGAAFAAVVGGVTLAAFLNPAFGDSGSPYFPFTAPGMISHFGASIAFVIAGGVCVGVAKAQARRQEKSQSRRTPAKSTRRGFVMPTIAPRPGGVSLGLTGVF